MTVETENVILDNIQSTVLSKNKTIITDFQNNRISLDNFEYQAKKVSLNQLVKLKL